MPRHLIKYSLFIGIGLLLAYFLGFISQKVERVYPIQQKRYQQLEKKKASIEAITIGSSHSVAIDFQHLQLNGYHTWFFAEDLFETAVKAEAIIPELPHLKTVFLCLPKIIFSHNNAVTEWGKQYRNKERIHYLLEKDLPIANDINSWANGNLADLVRYDHWVFMPKYLAGQDSIVPISELNSIEALTTDGNLRGETSGMPNLERLKEISLEKLEIHMDFMEAAEQKSISLQNRTQNALENIIRICQQHKVELILYTPPCSQSYLQNLPKRFETQFNHCLTSLQQKFKIHYFDFSNIPDSQQNPSYFQDGTHLSSRGAETFSKLLKERLEYVKEIQQSY